MRTVALGFSLLLAAASARAITWNFDASGDAQGWYAREGPASMSGSMERLPLQGEVHDGVWRIAPRTYTPGRYPSVEVVSPELRLPSELFDRIQLRVRLVHDRPVVGRVMVSWTNEHNAATPGEDPAWQPGVDRFQYLPPNARMTFTTDWQEIALTGFAEAAGVVWQDTLIDVRVELLLAELTAAGPDPAGVPEALEVDWIRLTGVEEQLQGELPPPDVPPPLSSKDNKLSVNKLFQLFFSIFCFS